MNDGKFEMRALDNIQKTRRSTMNELSSELDRVVCIDPAADAVAGFDHDDFEFGAAELARGGEPGDAGTDDENRTIANFRLPIAD